MHHFFVDKKDIQGEEAYIRGEDLRHIRNVLHLQLKEKLSISDRESFVYIGEIADMNKEWLRLRILERRAFDTELPSRITLFQALPKSDKMEWIIQKTVELGVHELVPVLCKRCIVQWDEKKMEKKRERWQEIAKAAAKQSKRGIIPRVRLPISYTEALEEAAACRHAFFAYENERGVRQTLDMVNTVQAGEDIALIIGPEGGFEDTELVQAKDKGCKIVSLGSRILRTESAGFVLLSLLMFHLEGLHG